MHGRALRGARVLVVGIAYKPNVADTRGSPALDVVAELRRRGASVAVHDPLVQSIAIDGESYVSEREVRGEDYDLVIVTTLHKGMNASSVAKAPLILDATYRLPSAGTGCALTLRSELDVPAGPRRIEGRHLRGPPRSRPRHPARACAGPL